jgi:hypothetical protein
MTKITKKQIELVKKISDASADFGAKQRLAEEALFQDDLPKARQQYHFMKMYASQVVKLQRELGIADKDICEHMLAYAEEYQIYLEDQTTQRLLAWRRENGLTAAA